MENQGHKEQKQEVKREGGHAILNVTRLITVGTIRSLSSISCATMNTPGITTRVRLRKHHRSVYGNLRAPRPSRSG